MKCVESARLLFVVTIFGQFLSWTYADYADVDLGNLHVEVNKTWIETNLAIFIVLIIAGVVILGFICTCCCCCCVCCRKGRQTVIVQGGAPMPQSTVVVSQQQQQMAVQPPVNPQHVGYNQ